MASALSAQTEEAITQALEDKDAKLAAKGTDDTASSTLGSATKAKEKSATQLSEATTKAEASRQAASQAVLADLGT